ncbi:MAG TPA: multiheme c-type cytochrome [Terriglobales bacterium]|nr:multiheme c-type cytochrome [Terriglobales bacterium]
MQPDKEFRPFFFLKAAGVVFAALSAIACSAAEPTSKYVGPGSCSASACHGGVQPMLNTRVLQNEYSTWVVQDPHARAFRSLENPASQRMGKILGIGDPARAHKCLACHALDVSAGERARDFDLSEGVSCESCHGPASAWLGPHIVKNWTPPQSIALGMSDLYDITRRSEKCLSCHLGTAEKEVDHEMIAAGHPDLVFELDSYTAIMPPHWKPANDPSSGARAWSVGQAVQLRDSLYRLARHSDSAKWPEYSELDCFSCHHSLTKPENSWRQADGYAGRTPGTPPWNASHYAMLRLIAQQLAPGSAAQLERGFEDLFRVRSRAGAPKAEIAAAARKAASASDAMLQEITAANIDRPRTAQLMREIAANGPSLAAQDTRTAEQAAMALNSLFISYSKDGAGDAGVRNAIDGLFRQLNDPSAYSAPRFREQMQRVSEALAAAGIR